jgi:SAM-dependent methyltransferase
MSDHSNRLKNYLDSISQTNVEKNLSDLLLNNEGYIGRFKFFTPYVNPNFFDSILISGCAAGSELLVAKQFGYLNIFGVDIDPNLIEIAKERLPGPEYNLMSYDGLNLNIADKSISTVYSGHVIEHTSNPEHYFFECLRVVRDGGFFFLEFPNRYHWRELHTNTFSFEWMPKKLRDTTLLFLERHNLNRNEILSSLFRDVRTTLSQISIGLIKNFISRYSREVKILKIHKPLPGYIRIIMRVGHD